MTVIAREHPEIDQWLRALAGDKYGQLVSWLKDLANDDDESTLVLFGPPATGKSLFVRGIERIFGGDLPVEETNEKPESGEFINVPREAAEFLKTVDTAKWVEGDTIAEHVLWLTRKK